VNVWFAFIANEFCDQITRRTHGFPLSCALDTLSKRNNPSAAPPLLSRHPRSARASRPP
jgi:hypothetical protein